jgi:hypothetical protein
MLSCVKTCASAPCDGCSDTRCVVGFQGLRKSVCQATGEAPEPDRISDAAARYSLRVHGGIAHAARVIDLAGALEAADVGVVCVRRSMHRGRRGLDAQARSAARPG